jgi:hypothetical protein
MTQTRQCPHCQGTGRLASRKWQERRGERIAWLRLHPELWESGFADRDLFVAMKRSGMFAPTTYWKDVRIREMVEDAKATMAMVPSGRSYD